MTAADRELLGKLPPELTAAQILRQALASFRAAVPACEHRRVHCSDCGAEFAELADLEAKELEPPPAPEASIA